MANDIIKNRFKINKKEILNRNKLNIIKKYNVEKYKIIISYLNKTIEIENSKDFSTIEDVLNFATKDLPHSKLILEKVTYINTNDLVEIYLNPLISSA